MIRDKSLLVQLRTCDLQTADVLVGRANLTSHIHTTALQKHKPHTVSNSTQKYK